MEKEDTVNTGKVAAAISAIAEKALAVKDAVVDKALVSKDVVVEKALAAKDFMAEKAGEVAGAVKDKTVGSRGILANTADKARDESGVEANRSKGGVGPTAYEIMVQDGERAKAKADAIISISGSNGEQKWNATRTGASEKSNIIADPSVEPRRSAAPNQQDNAIPSEDRHSNQQSSDGSRAQPTNSAQQMNPSVAVPKPLAGAIAQQVANEASADQTDAKKTDGKSSSKSS